MKIQTSPLKFHIGPHKGNSFYKIKFVFQKELSSLLGDKFSLQINSKVFSADFGQELKDETEKIIYVGLGDKDKIIFRKFAGLFLKY